MKKILVSALALLAGLSFSAFGLEKSIADNEKVEKVESVTSIGKVKGTRIFVVGDSTLSSFDDKYFYPRYGYGTRIQDYLLEKKATVINLAMSGRSSKSFLTEANYKTLKDNIKKGDYLIIGFGHNDEKAEEARYTNPNGTKETAGSFKNSLYENYVKLAYDAKATPILCTPIVRRAPGKTYEGSVVHVTADVQGFPGGDYPKAIRELGKETNTLVVDLTAITKDRYEKLANDAETAKFHAQLTHKAASVDNTHLNYYGAAVIANDVVKAISASDKKFAKLVNKKAAAPTEDLLALAKNPDYVIPKYSEFIPEEDASQNFKTTAPWYGTVFGDCGGAEKIANPELYEIVEKDGKILMHSGSTDSSKSAGKIASSSDGIAFYFQKVDGSKDFTFSATAKVLSTAKNNQVGFGLMVRDDVYIDKFDNTINTDYVAVGGYKMASEPQVTSWTRIDAALKTTNATAVKFDKGTSVNLSITKKGETYTVKCGNEPAVEYKAGLDNVDFNNLYVGLFTSRAVYVEFSNVSLKVSK
ncbi:SGNH/GDSL hydrolase family protein [Treponema zioleckii]|uniref:SGNH/GDSL hydrolase family protein n=1 Tax=Treponema zioleckii TaxID=331680 RepID=UPI00168B9131|nr:SGNH/GDSL hydrolase family protein [Treponema zioleckii]